MLFLLLSSLPLLAISAHEFGLISLRASAFLLILPVAAILAVSTTFAPYPIDGIVGRGLIAGMVACLAYDAFRLTAVYVLGWMGDFIPIMGTGITADPDIESGAAVGYIWRYIGDGGGLGVAFYLLAFAVGLDRWSRWPGKVVLAAAAFAVFPVWTGLVATVLLTSLDGGETLFHLRPDTLAITLVGHVIFGVVVGLGFMRGLDVVRMAVALAPVAARASQAESMSVDLARPEWDAKRKALRRDAHGAVCGRAGVSRPRSN